MMTLGQIKKAARGERYLLLRDAWGIWWGINTIMLFKGDNIKHSDNLITEYTGYSKCNINQYISNKCGFVKS